MASPLFEELKASLDALGASTVAVIGSGGKTSIIIGLAKVLKEKGVLITTTTHLAAPIHVDYSVDEWVSDPNAQVHVGLGKRVLWAKEGAKLGPVNQDLLQEASAFGGYTLIEADGARGKPFAFHHETEPVIPAWVDCVIAVVGLGGIGKPLNEETFHREGEYRRVTGSKETQISMDTLGALLAHPSGILKGTIGHPTILVFTQSDLVSPALAEEAWNVGRKHSRCVAVLCGTTRGNE